MGHLLLLDSDKSLLRSLELLLSERYQLRALVHPHLALNILKREKFDLLLTDISFRSNEFLSFLKNVKQLQPQISIILMYTVFNDDEELELEIKGLADHVLYKPLDPETLSEKIEDLITAKQI